MNGPVRSAVHREVIDRAWTRSRMCGLDHGSLLDLPFDASFDVDSAFTRAARPVLDYLGGLLPGCGTAAVLLDTEGRLLVRVCDDPSLARRMDDGNSLPGIVWSEEYAGANAVGIALEERVPTWTSGQDHYLEALRDLACAAVPVVNPLTQRVVGVLDLTAQLSKASALMLPMALQAARTIEQRLVDAGTLNERVLLSRFMTASRRSGRAVLAVSARTELSNNTAARLLDPADRALLAYAASEHPDSSREIALSDGSQVRARFESVTVDDHVVGSLVTIGSSETRSTRRSRTATTPRTRQSAAMAAEYVGRSASSAALRADALTMADATFPLLITGEPGVGKLRLAKIVARMQERVVMLDARSYSAEGDAGLVREVSALSRQTRLCVILRHVDALPNDVLQEISALARTAEDSGSRVIATATSTGTLGEDTRVPIGVRLYIPPLRERPEDVLDVAPHLLARRRAQVQLAPSVLQAMLRCDWPGNVSELDMVLAGMVHRGSGSALTLADLPAHYQRGARRLRRIEQVERTAIVQALAEAGGNKSQAAQILEIGRATLYRKMRTYGLDPHDLAI